MLYFYNALRHSPNVIYFWQNIFNTNVYIQLKFIPMCVFSEKKPVVEDHNLDLANKIKKSQFGRRPLNRRSANTTMLILFCSDGAPEGASVSERDPVFRTQLTNLVHGGTSTLSLE